MNEQKTAIEAHNVRRVYQSGVHEVVALDGINMQIPEGHFIALKGRSGSGKTTLLNCLGGLDQPTDGHIRIFDREIHALDEEENTSWRQKEVGFIFQSFGLLPTLSAYENVELMLRIAGFPRSERRERAMAVLDLVGLRKWADHRPFELSGGQQQRVAIARALANKPSLILADEATGELDSETALEVLGLLRRIVREEGVTILLATHDSLVDDYVDEVVELVDGQIVALSGSQGENGRSVVQTSFEPTTIDPDPSAENSAGVGSAAPQQQAKAESQLEPDRLDYGIALLVGFVALLAYLRTMAPDILYGDSGEFQVLAHTPGIAHTTGYPIYIFITMLLRNISIETLAWRVNFLSVLGAAATVAMVYLNGRFVTRSRLATGLAAFALGISYTLWSQAVIAEVYTVGTFWVAAIIFLLWRWSRAPQQRLQSLYFGVLLVPLSLGVHLYVSLTIPAAIIFTLAVIWTQRPKVVPPLVIATLATVIGFVLYFASFYWIDAQQAVTDYNQVVLFPARELWDLTEADFATWWQRLYLSLTAPQWQAAMFPGDAAFMLEKLVTYLARFFIFEFGIIAVIAGFVGLRRVWRGQRQQGVYLLIAFITVLFAIINYDPGDKHLFYLPSYVVFAVALAPGIEAVLQWGQRRLRSRTAVEFQFLAIILLLLLGQHFWPSRISSLAAGRANFVFETYPFPEDLTEPRRVAEERIAELPQGAVLLMDWRDLYAMYYMGRVENQNPAIEIFEATPFGANGRVPNGLVDIVTERLENGRFVYTAQPYRNLAPHFNLTPVEDLDLMRLTLK
ncbi:MAG: ATP-binding cassette domain-containing protein [Chloroflexota bacterium]